jgi:hypothetical protein
MHARLWAPGTIELSGGHNLISNGDGKVGPIANQGIRAPAKQPLHVRGLVDRPQVDFESGSMRVPDEPPRDHSQ